jgi:sec-independent protein translocase protein TatC
MQEQWAGFWDHVDDLRHTLLRSLIIVGVGFLFLLLFYEPLLQFLTFYPLEQTEEGLTNQKIQRVQITNQANHDQIFTLPNYSWLIAHGNTTYLLPKTEGSYSLAPGQTLIYEEVIHSPLLIMSPIEGLTLVFKVCFWLSIVLTAPIWGWIWLQFILPALKERERAVLFPFLFCSLLCLGIGIALAYYVTLPIANQYLLLFNSSIGQNTWTLAHYVDYVLLLCLGHAVAAELALLLFLLVHFRILSPHWLITKRRYMIVLAFILGALLTPPDVFTQLLLAIPLIALYEVAIGYAKWLEKKASREYLNNI